MRQFSHQTQLLRLAIIAGAVTAAACSSAADSTRPLDQSVTDFQTDSISYSLASDGRWYSGTIGVTYTNRTDESESFDNCGGATDVRLEKLTDGEWTTVWSPVLLACFSPLIVVAPGEARRMDFFIAAGYPGTNTVPQFSTERISGVYRAEWDAMTNPDGVAPPIEHRVSNEFNLAAPNP
jgi:hypothetical protein